jgi:hypothetical protein
VVDVKTPLLRKAAVALAVGGALGVGTAAGFGVASAVSTPGSSNSATTTAASDPSAGPGNTADTHGDTTKDSYRRFPHAHGLPGRLGALGRRVEHGEVTVKGKDGKPVVWDIQHGQVTAVSATSISVRSEDGFTATYVVNGDTRVRVGTDKKAIGDIKTGAQVGVAGTRSGSTVTAAVVGSR